MYDICVLLGLIASVVLVYTLLNIAIRNYNDLKRKRYRSIKTTKTRSAQRHKKAIKGVVYEPLNLQPDYEGYINAAWDEVNK